MQPRQTPIARWCERIIEGGWLLALVMIPSYFNLLSARHFEPDKATTLRGIVLIMLAAAIIGWLEGRTTAPRHTTTDSATPRGPAHVWQRIRAIPLALPVLVYIGVFLIATALSVVPLTSFWGSYQRLQGTYTNLAYVGLGALIALNLRRREQFERLVTVTILGSLIAVGYGLVQHFQLDPLPWGGDVVTRVASTMGNSIFVAAYLIMIVPFVLYRAIVTAHAAHSAPRAESAAGDWGWALAYLLLILGALLLAFAAIQFGAVVRTNDLRYWWVYPGALVVALLLYLVPTLRPHQLERISPVLVLPGIAALLYVLFVGFSFSIGQSVGGQVVQSHGDRGGTEWPIWMVGSMLLVIAAYALFYVLPRRAAPPSALFLKLQSVGMIVVALLVLVTIFFTQSRGPWLGAFAGLFVFFTLLFWFAFRRDRAAGSPRAALWRNLLIAELVFAFALGGFIVTFNFSNAPVFEQLREVPYIGRMGRLLDTSPGTTGDVRMKIWFGDEQASGAVGLITANPWRALVGWGPESMFVAYNPFYPPSLANVEARGASPDRSHQAYLDELVTRGFLGLASYLFVLLSFFALAWRLLHRVEDWRMQVFFIACIAVVVAHSVEGMTGIPIVATLMLLWVTLGGLVASGALTGQYSLDATPAPAPVEPEPVAETPTPAAKGRGTQPARRRQAASRGAQASVARRRGRQALNPAMLLVYGLIMLAALVGVWSTNVDNVYADMRFQQARSFAEAPNADLQQQFAGLTFNLAAVRMEPNQDFYYLSLGRNLMSITDIQRQLGVELGSPNPNARISDLLLQPDDRALQEFVLGQTLQETVSYAEAVLLRAYELNPRNKDHSANLARLYKFWYSRLTQDPAQLQASLEWYERGRAVAPNDVVILNEYAGTLAMLGEHSVAQGDTTTAQTYFAEAETLLAESKRLDPRYGETDVLQADLLRLQGRYDDAMDRYVALLEQNPRVLHNQFNLIVTDLIDQPEQLERLLDAYATAAEAEPDDRVFQAFIGQLAVLTGDMQRAEQAYARQVALDPQSIEARQNYTLILSDTQQYERAAAEAEAILALVQQDQQQVAQLQGWINFLRERAGG